MLGQFKLRSHKVIFSSIFSTYLIHKLSRALLLLKLHLRMFFFFTEKHFQKTFLEKLCDVNQRVQRGQVQQWILKVQLHTIRHHRLRSKWRLHVSCNVHKATLNLHSKYTALHNNGHKRSCTNVCESFIRFWFDSYTLISSNWHIKMFQLKNVEFINP